MKNFIKCILLGCLLSFTTTIYSKDFVLVIDAGHGGKDSGAVGQFSKEKDINLSVALAFGKYVEQNCRDVKVIYTRRTDVFIPLSERANIANKNKADLFISIHTNALAKGNISRGLETYTLGMHRANDNLDVAKRENSVILIEDNYKEKYQGFDPKSAESYIMFEFMQDKNMHNSVNLAKFIQQETCKTTNRANKGVHQAGFLVLRATSMPSCLIELGFISTPDEEQYLNTKEGIDNFAIGIYNAFTKYKNKHYYSKHKELPAKKTEENKNIDKEVITITNNIDNKINNDNDSVINTNETIYKVQIMASKIKIDLNSKEYKNLPDIDFYEEDNYIKYTVGKTTDYKEIQKIRQDIIKQYPQAFIIAFKNGQKVK